MKIGVGGSSIYPLHSVCLLCIPMKSFVLPSTPAEIEKYIAFGLHNAVIHKLFFLEMKKVTILLIVDRKRAFREKAIILSSVRKGIIIVGEQCAKFHAKATGSNMSW